MTRDGEGIAEMQVDLHANELLVLTILANLGSAVMAGNREDAKALGDMLLEVPESEATAFSALSKLESSMKLAVTIARGGTIA